MPRSEYPTSVSRPVRDSRGSERAVAVQRSLSFGSVAEDYERYRPGYSDDLVRLIIGRATGEVRRAIEIGAGTGKATRAFARAGIEVTAVEPDPAMLAVLRRECAGLPVHAELKAYEDVEPDGEPYDLFYAAAALHWTRPKRRWDRAAALLRPGAAVASFGGPIDIGDPGLAAIESAVVEPYMPGHHIDPPSAGAAGLDWPGDELLAHDQFTDVRQQTVPRRMIMPRDDYLRHLNTISAYRMLSEADRAAILAELAQRLPEQVPVQADLVLHTARRV